MKYHVNANNQMVQEYTIKEIFEDNWDDFIIAMNDENRTIRRVVLREVDKIISCQDPQKRLRFVCLFQMQCCQTRSFYLQKQIL